MALDRTRFCLNRIIYPKLELENFFQLTGEVGLRCVELRNDLPGGRILDDRSPQEVKSLAEAQGIQIMTINAVQKFNLGAVLEGVCADVKKMLDTAAAIGCKAIVLCPNNDVNDVRTPEQCYRDTVATLKTITPWFEDAGMIGLVEPLGFAECSLRSKKTAIQAIQASGYDGYRLVHDTFHHYLGPDESFYPQQTGLVHISGVETNLPKAQIRDGHRILIGVQDLMSNKAQISALESQGYAGLYSFEPFSSDVQKMSLGALKDALKASLEFLTT